MKKRESREELIKRLNDYEKQEASKHEPSAEEIERANKLARELERERNWRSSGGFIRPA